MVTQEESQMKRSEAYRRHKAELTRVLVNYVAVFTLPALIGSLVRIPTSGWQPTFVIQIVLASGILLVWLFRNRISPQKSAMILITLLSLVGLSGLVQFGAAAVSMAYLVFTVFCSVILVSISFAIKLMGVIFLGMISIAIAKLNGYLLDIAIYQELHSDLRAWINVILSLLFLTMCSLALISKLLVFYKELMQAQDDKLVLGKEKLAEVSSVLFDKERQFESLIGQLPGVAYRCSATSERPLRFISAYVEQITGNPPEFYLAHNNASLNQLIHIDDIRPITTLIDFKINKLGQYSLEYRVRTEFGTDRFVLDRGIVHQQEHSEGKVIDGFILDITELKVLENELRESRSKAQEANEAKTQFLATMSHEIRTPMNGIMGLVQLLEKTPINDEQKGYVEKLMLSSRTMVTILNDILDFSKIEAGQLQVESIDFSLRQIISYIESMFSPSCLDKGVKFVSTIDPYIKDIRQGDPTRLTQVLFNLVSNASKFTHQGKVTVDVSEGKRADELVFTISDTGVGIDDTHLAQLFQPFTQADASITRKYGGTGLGLSICYRLVQLMNGKIEVTSKVGKGTQFNVILHMPEADSQEFSLTVANEEAQDRFIEKKVLLVEDNKVNQLVAKKLLEQYQLKVDIAEDGKEAIEQITNNDYELVLMDIFMPVMDGVSATQSLRESGVSIPIIALTANTLESDIEKYFTVGMNDYIAKPIETNRLISVLSKYL